MRITRTGPGKTVALAVTTGVLVLFTAMLCSAGAQKGRPESEGQIDEAGPYVITNGDWATGSAYKKHAEIREFIWDHWRRQRRGRVAEKSSSKDGAPSDTVFVVEPDDKGHWSIRVDTTWTTGKHGITEQHHSGYRTHDVRRVGFRGSGSQGSFMPDEVTRNGDSYKLVFYDENGKEIGGA